jgi:hypothetical protein
MTREELIEVMAQGICAGQGRHWEDQFGIYSSNGDPLAHEAFKHTASRALAALEAAGVRLVPVAWTDDDQTGLNAAVYDAMWHWEDRPIDVDDAMSLASAIKASISENGLMIVSASFYAPPGG